jgi:hypothetical protein
LRDCLTRLGVGYFFWRALQLGKINAHSEQLDLVTTQLADDMLSLLNERGNRTLGQSSCGDKARGNRAVVAVVAAAYGEQEDQNETSV